ncbi:hypothetical protein PC129_g9396 [Phytophthora cactorum]|uniref:Uncharacterized protein n=1 Tax=Phytophthora cactorum TaxID=29920 RepID=A0A8T1I683_9STRA|nr:hypothetical protein Pcac1_g12516 [Phytophthora cactorum]KAG2905930.1 hypothetical protein PC114_g11357 [Phytophthora cactorum]KAG2944031.1 hypothetical protein PC117_g9191 [Phytophthora cactorum]KAG3007270.1 hypothetical protein PC119_g14634 [Phytophthora cactorum]KAG3018939.1 hypothetical protein PC120_g10162 [Phytophthora cactorum]
MESTGYCYDCADVLSLCMRCGFCCDCVEGTESGSADED